MFHRRLQASLLLADSVEKVGFEFHTTKVRS